MNTSHDTPLLAVLVEIDPPTLLVRLEGEIDLSCVGLLDSIEGLNLVDVTEVTLDLDGLDFTDSAGTRAILRLRTRLLANGLAVQVTGPRPLVRRVFRLLGEDHVLAA